MDVPSMMFGLLFVRWLLELTAPAESGGYNLTLSSVPANSTWTIPDPLIRVRCTIYRSEAHVWRLYPRLITVGSTTKRMLMMYRWTRTFEANIAMIGYFHCLQSTFSIHVTPRQSPSASCLNASLVHLIIDTHILIHSYTSQQPLYILVYE
ncbi:hypothetical protein BD779DRAFT_300994 [Infundibulicybe gibba]|nr:hypothetical protein BD779DRAFT_300994 [Infundibulicybe gibba]